MDTTTQVLAILIILIGLVLTTVAPQFVRRRRSVVSLRPQSAYAGLNDMAASSVEGGRTILVGLGSVALGGESTVLALAAEEIAYQTVARVAYGDREPAVTASDGTGLSIAFDAVRKAYRRQGRSTPRGAARWLPPGPRSLAYAAAMTAYVSGDGASSQVLVGRYGVELALIAEASVRRGGLVIAASDQLDGQAAAFVFSKHTLIGEEIFQAAAYLGDSAVRRGEVAALDILRWVLIVVVVALAANRLIISGG